MEVVDHSSSPSHSQNSPKRRLACASSGSTLAHIFNALYRKSCLLTKHPSHRLIIQQQTSNFHPTKPKQITTTFRKVSTMAGGKGKSSGGKSSGGKSGHDSGKKQQSHSSKAGLQVSIAQSSIQHLQRHRRSFGGIPRSGSMVDPTISSPRSVASST